jgi:hypothetical protein
MEIAALTNFLAPFLGPLIAGTQEAAAEAIGRFGQAAWEQAGELWHKVGDRVWAREPAKEAAEDVAKQPDDVDAKAALAWQLKKLLESDQALMAEVSRIWQNAESAGVTNITITASGPHSFAAQSVSNATINTGFQGSATPEPRSDDRHPKVG